MEITSTTEGLKAQETYLAKLESEGFEWDLMVGEAFIRGMRDIGYKSTAFAMAELIDNAVQASASNVDIVFGFGNSDKKPTKIAIVDDGYGMKPKMVRASLIWGAGTRANDRSGFGKYGYGLPSASVSQCERTTVYSKAPSGEWYASYLDITEIAEGQRTVDNRIQTPEEQVTEPPEFVVDYLKDRGRWGDFSHGTIVVWERLDRIDYKTRDPLRATLLTDLGVIYRHFLSDTTITVDGEIVEPCDPLFLTEGFRYYDLDSDRAKALPPAVVEVKDKSTGDVVGRMRLRFSLMPPTFFRKPEYKDNHKSTGSKAMNERLPIADANNGIVFLRNSRQIDVVRPPRRFKGAALNSTTDRFWGVEVDFDATLDEEFSITTSKQQVKPSDRIWDILESKAKIFEVIGNMRTDYKKRATEIKLKAEHSATGTERPSVEAVQRAEKFKTTKAPKDTPERREEAKRNLEQEAKRRSTDTGVEPEFVERQLEAQQEGHPFAVTTEDVPGGVFYRCVQLGGQRILYLNVAHPFYTELYNGPESSPRIRAALEVLLWALGEAEIDAEPGSDRRKFYERERATVWSPYVADVLTALNEIAIVEEADEDAA